MPSKRDAVRAAESLDELGRQVNEGRLVAPGWLASQLQVAAVTLRAIGRPALRGGGVPSGAGERGGASDDDRS